MRRVSRGGFAVSVVWDGEAAWWQAHGPFITGSTASAGAMVAHLQGCAAELRRQADTIEALATDLERVEAQGGG